MNDNFRLQSIADSLEIRYKAIAVNKKKYQLKKRLIYN